MGLESIRAAVDFALDCGASPRLAEFSPIPRTPQWAAAVAAARLPIADEPLLHNNSVYYRLHEGISDDELCALKLLIRERLAAPGALNRPDANPSAAQSCKELPAAE